MIIETIVTTMDATGAVNIAPMGVEWDGGDDPPVLKPFLETTVDEWDRVINTDLRGTYLCCRAVIPHMLKSGGGSIVNINSGTAFMTIPQYSVYSSSKRALLAFSLTARAELEKDRIVVSEIYPFITATNFGKNRMGSPAGGGPIANYADGDKPEFVAGLVLEAIEEGQAQYFANDRLRKMAGGAT